MKHYRALAFATLALACSQESATTSTRSTPEQPVESTGTPEQPTESEGTPSEEGTAPGAEGLKALPQPKQAGPKGHEGGPLDGSDENYQRPGFVFLDDWDVTHVVTGHFTGDSDFSESTARLQFAPDGYQVNGFTDYAFVPDNGVSEAFAAMPATRCSVTDEMILGTSDATTIDIVSVSWGTTQVVDGDGEPHDHFGGNVAWNEPAVPFGVQGGERVLLLLLAQPYPLIGQGAPESVRYIPVAVFPVVDGVVTQEDNSALTLSQISAQAAERLAAKRAAYDQRLACLAPTDFPAWPGYSDPTCHATCETPVEEGSTGGAGDED